MLNRTVRRFLGIASLERVASLSRRASWVSAVLIGASVAWRVQPLTVESLLTRTQALQYSYADVYSELHEQPFAFCASYYAQREETLNGIRARARELPASSLLAALTIAREYDAAIGRQYEQDCREEWRPYQNPANFQKVFTQDYPLYYLVSELNLTEVRLALAQIVTGGLGVVAVALLSVCFWRSSLAPIVGLVLTSWLVRAALRGAMAARIPVAMPVATVSQYYLFPAVTVLLIIAMVQPVMKRTGRPTPMWIGAGLALLYGLHTLLYYVVDPPVARVFALVGVAYVAGVGLAFRRWQVVVVAVLAGGVQLALDALLRGPGLEVYAAVTRTNHLASAAYNSIMMFTGLFERPTPFGLFYMDEMFGWVIDQDPVLMHMAPFLAVHHSYEHIGNAMLWHAISTEPLTLVDAVFRRVLIQIFYRPLWFFWTLKVDWVYTSTLLGIFVLNALAWMRRPLFVVVTPITLCLLVNQFAVNTLMTLVHTHARWNVVGVMLMFAVAPLYLFVAVDLLFPTIRRWRDRRWSAVASAVPARPVWIAGVVLVLAASGWFVRLAVTTVGEEREFVHVWMTVHEPPPGKQDLLRLVGEIESTRDRARQRRGQTDMWTASILRMYLGRHPELPPEEARQLDQLRQMRYRRAIALAPENPHFLFLARFLQIDRWESHLLEALRRFPDSIYAPGAVAALHHYGGDLPNATRASVARQYERLTSRFLDSAPGRVPGFEAVPAAVHTQSGTVKAERADRPEGRSGLVLTMSPGAMVFVSDTSTHGSSIARVFSYVDLQAGDVETGIAFGGEGRERRVAGRRVITKESQTTAGRYLAFEANAVGEEAVFGLWLRAGAQGATVELRDYYPAVDSPQHYYRSGLMERVRLQAARSRL